MDKQLQETQSKKAILDFSLDELEAYLKPKGAPSYRAKQVFSWLYRDTVTSFQQMTNVPNALRNELERDAYIPTLEPVTEVKSEDGLTRKVLLRLHDGAAIESVLMLYSERKDSKARRTVCISSQSGCGMGCSFCATGIGGLTRNLTSGEIADQILYFARQLAAEGESITNVVVMGQGEPLINFHEVLKAITTLNSPYGFGLGARHFTVSTVGIVPKIRELARTDLQIGLAVSLHAPNDDLRSSLMPINKKYPLNELIGACSEYVRLTNRRITFEYALIDGINDSKEHAAELSNLTKGLLCHVNLIPLNDVSGSAYRPSPEKKALEFQNELVRHGITTTMRVKRGGHIDAACGQLAGRLSTEKK